MRQKYNIILWIIIVQTGAVICRDLSACLIEVFFCIINYLLIIHKISVCKNKPFHGYPHIIIPILCVCVLYTVYTMDISWIEGPRADVYELWTAVLWFKLSGNIKILTEIPWESVRRRFSNGIVIYFFNIILFIVWLSCNYIL